MFRNGVCVLIAVLYLATAAFGVFVWQPAPRHAVRHDLSHPTALVAVRMLSALSGTNLHVASERSSPHLVPMTVSKLNEGSRAVSCNIIIQYTFDGRLGNFFFEISAAYAVLRNLSAIGYETCWHVQINQRRKVLSSYSPLLRAWRGKLLGMHRERVVLPRLTLVARLPMFDGPNAIMDDAHRLRSPKMAQALAAHRPMLLQLSGLALGRWLWASYAYELYRAYAPPANVSAELHAKYPLGAAMCYHVRGGDKARGHHHRYFVARDGYYAAAFEHARRVHGGHAPAVHLVATDDWGFVRSMPYFSALRHAGTLQFIAEKPLQSVWALSLCEYGLATAASTMSWWAGFIRAMNDTNAAPRQPTPIIMPDRLRPKRSLVGFSYLAPWATVLDPRGGIVQRASNNRSL